MGDTSPKNQRALQHNAPKAPPRQPKPGEFLFEFHVERTHACYRCELRDHGEYGVEAQFFDPVDLRLAHTFPRRELAIAWAQQERTAIERPAMWPDAD
jgi:hypothetical protein